MSLPKCLFLLVLLNPFPAKALECQWWQTKVKRTTIPQHQREGHKVSTHPRQEHCREKWKGADQNINLFSDDKIPNWNPREKLKSWSRGETQLILEIISKLPAWVPYAKHRFYRAEKSIHAGNPATQEKTTSSIVIYDLFFKRKDQPAIVVHESSHAIYDSLTEQEKFDFGVKSGWHFETDFKEAKVYERPPLMPIQPDSVSSKDEDFANHVEEFFKDPATYKQRFPVIYNDFIKRFVP